MATNIQWFPKSSPNLPGEAMKNPISLNRLDELVAAEVGEDVHPTRWCRGWFNYIGRDLSERKTYNQIREKIRQDDAEGVKLGWNEAGGFIAYMMPILDYLEKNYEHRSWSSIGR